MATVQQDSLGTGRRKTSVARVRIRSGNGQIQINKRELTEFFPNIKHQNAVLAALSATEEKDKVDVVVRVHGGGMTGQADAIKLGIARALRKHNEEHYEVLKDNHLLTRDARKKERKKYGLHGARRGTQFSKR